MIGGEIEFVFSCEALNFSQSWDESHHTAPHYTPAPAVTRQLRFYSTSSRASRRAYTANGAEMFCQVGAVFEEFGLVLILLAGLAQLLSCSRVPIIAILTLDFLECHVKRHEEPVKGPRGLTVACIRLWPDFDPSKTLLHWRE